MSDKTASRPIQSRRSMLRSLAGIGALAAPLALPEKGMAEISPGDVLLSIPSITIRPFSGRLITPGARVIASATIGRLDGQRWGIAGIPATFAIGTPTYASELAGYISYSDNNGVVVWDFRIGSYVSRGNKVLVVSVNGASARAPLPFLRFVLS